MRQQGNRGILAPGGSMGVVQVQQPDHLKQVIERQVAKGRALNEADFLAEAVRGV
jgi:Arc/MetJ-type ribon-helix-helix transcriptional regulator